MNPLRVPRLESMIPAREISSYFDSIGIEYHLIKEINWQEFPYLPEVSFRIAHMDTAILLNFQVKEKSIKATYSQDNDPVYKDSCVEMFIQFEGEEFYYNIECNCIATLLMGSRKSREDKTRASQEVVNQIERWSSLERIPFKESKEISFWEVSWVIPVEVFFKSDMKTLSGTPAKANFYKCGDDLEEPHYVSWNRIESSRVDFHRPDFFGEIYFT